ncbi:MAG TPA: molybdenum cofactor biosynthesis protein MoaE [Thermoanaerobaculia bacterium]|nr:molybdenum cofactor biosynthesis protein MoaE [Thermoanaerobaculia bacterium]
MTLPSFLRSLVGDPVAESHLTDDPIDAAALMQRVMRNSDGALAFFAGAVRNHHEGRSVESIFYDAYRPMAEKEIDSILRQIRTSHPMVQIALVHRLGLLRVGDVSIAIACSSPHRADAFAACREAIDLVKQTVPIWKKEKSERGEEWAGWQGDGPARPVATEVESHTVTSSQLPRGAGYSTEDAAVVPAASTIVVRDDPFEVLLYRRNPKSTFVPGAWVFPGGSVEREDQALAESVGGSRIDVMKICAIRELFEESGVWIGENGSTVIPHRGDLIAGRRSFSEIVRGLALPVEQLTWTARWITPVGVPKRFDTYFFLASVSRDLIATADGEEGVDVLWIAPSEALERHERGELSLMFPTIRNLGAIAHFDSSHALITSTEGIEIRTMRPVLIVEGDRKRIVLPSGESDE